MLFAKNLLQLLTQTSLQKNPVKIKHAHSHELHTTQQHQRARENEKVRKRKHQSRLHHNYGARLFQQPSGWVSRHIARGAVVKGRTRQDECLSRLMTPAHRPASAAAQKTCRPASPRRSVTPDLWGPRGDDLTLYIYYVPHCTGRQEAR